MKRFLLYIDFLGFSDLVAAKPQRIDMLYQVVNSLNVHKHDAFRTIVFSDTVLVYNTAHADNDGDRKYLVMYACEFAQDLQRRLVGQDIFFRAVLVLGKFEHYELPNVECFYGSALIKAYLREKDIPAVGLFIDDACNQFNDIFKTTRFDKDLSFVHLNQSLEHLNRDTGGQLPVPRELLYDYNYPDLIWDIRYLKDIRRNMLKNPRPRVRTKYLTTWALFRGRYQCILDALEQANFSPNVICPDHDWSDDLTRFRGDLQSMRSLCVAKVQGTAIEVDYPIKPSANG